MTLENALTYLPTLALAIGLAASTGLRAWLPLLATSLLARFDVVTLGDSFAFLSSTPAIVLFAVATVLEIAADKIPVLDHGLDVVSTVIRPIAAAVLAGAVMFQIHDPLWAMVLGLIVGAPTALVPHAVKSGVRVASTATTGGLTNPVVSVAEDTASLTMVVLAVVVPIVAAGLVLVLSFLALRWWRRRRHVARSATSA